MTKRSSRIRSRPQSEEVKPLEVLTMDPRKGANVGRRRFLTGAGKYGALIVGAKYLSEASLAAQGEGDSRPVQEKAGYTKLIGLSQRRAGLMKRETASGD